MNNSGINCHSTVTQNVVSKINRGHALSLLGQLWTSFITHNHFKSSKFEFEPQIKEEHKQEWTYKGY